MPEALLPVLVALAGGVGAVCRLLLDGAVSAWIARRGAPSSLPWGIIFVNLSGSLLIGAAAGLFAGAGVCGGASPCGPDSAAWPLALSFGLLGGYTTFSTASFQTVQLARRGRWGAALLNGLGQLVVACAAVALGWALVQFVV